MLDNNIEQPFAQDAEQVVVASCLLTDGADTFDVVSQIVTSEDFYDPKCKIIYQCMEELAKDLAQLKPVRTREHNRELQGN